MQKNISEITCISSPENQIVVTSNFQYLRHLYQRDRKNELYKVMQFISLLN